MAVRRAKTSYPQETGEHPQVIGRYQEMDD
jgi:hypothetical protein